MASKIDQIKIGSTSYDIDLPVDAAPSIASLNVTGSIQAGSLTDGTTTKTMTEVLAGGGNDYDDLDNIPIINQDLEAIGFTPVEDTYYRHTGTSTSLVPLSVGVNPGTLYFDTTKSISAMTTILDGIKASVTPYMDETSSKVYIFISRNAPPFSHDSDIDQAICLYWFSADAARSMRTDGQAEPLYIVMHLDFTHEAFNVLFANAAFRASSDVLAEIAGWQPNSEQLTYNNTIALVDGSAYVDQFVHYLGEIFHTGKIYYYHNGNYLNVPNSSIIEQNLLDESFIPVNNTYYKNIGGAGTANAPFATGQKLADGTKVRVNTSQVAQTELVNYLEALIPPTTSQQQLSSLVVSSSLYEQQSRVFGLIMYIAPGTSSEVPNGAYTIYDSLDAHTVLFVHYIDPAPSSVTPGAEEGFHNIGSDGTVTIEDGFTVGTILPSAGGYSWNGTIFTSVVDNIESGKIYYYNNGIYYDLLKYPKPELIDARNFIVEPDEIKTENTLYFEYDSTDYTAKLVRKSGSYYNNNTYVIPKYTKNDTDGCWYKVTAIDDYAFNTRSSLTSITLPDSIETIGSYAFSGCTSLTSINLSSSLKTIKNSAFYGCSSLTNIELPEGLEEIGEYAFYNNAMTSLTVPSTVEEISAYAFSYCQSLASIHLTEGIKQIDSYAFEFNTALTHITIPASVETAQTNAFYACSNLATIDVLRDDDSTLSAADWASSASTVTYRRRVGSYIKSASATSSSISLVDQDGNTTTFSPAASDNYYHTPSYNSGLKIATGTGVNDMYVPTGNTASSVVVGNDSRLHTHSNKTALDNLTQTVIDNSHTHSNKTALDNFAVTSTSVTDGTNTFNLPGNVSSFTNDAGYITSSALSSYVPTSRTINSKALSSNITLVASDVNALPSYSLNISTGQGNPREVKFVRVNYSTFDGNNAAYFRIGAMCSHGNGSSYTFLEDIIIGVSATPAVTCTIYKQVQNTSTYTVDNHTVYFGDVYWIVNTTDKYVDFYIIAGQYATINFTPFMKIGATVSDTSKIVQYTSANYYSSGTRVWNAIGNGSLYALSKDYFTYYGTCSTAAATKDKVATISDATNFSLRKGVIVGIKFSNTNTFSASADAGYVTLNVNSTGAKNIWWNNTGTPTGTNTKAFGYANRTIYYMYDGTYWVFLSASTDDNSTGYLSYTATSVGNTDTNIQYLIGKRTVSSNGTNYYNSTIYFKGYNLYSTNVYASSDERLKENIKPAELNYRQVIDNLQIKEFNFKADKEKKVVVGAIAQELKEILPEKYQAELVSGSEEEYYSINEGKLLYIAIGALKDEMQKTKDLEERLERVEKLLEK